MGQMQPQFENEVKVLSSPFPSEVFPILKKPKRQMISVVSPTYNERENISLLIQRISQVLSGRKYEIIVVDDNSSDGTIEVAKELAKDHPVKTLVRNGYYLIR